MVSKMSELNKNAKEFRDRIRLECVVKNYLVQAGEVPQYVDGVPHVVIKAKRMQFDVVLNTDKSKITITGKDDFRGYGMIQSHVDAGDRDGYFDNLVGAFSLRPSVPHVAEGIVDGLHADHVGKNPFFGIQLGK